MFVDALKTNSAAIFSAVHKKARKALLLSSWHHETIQKASLHTPASTQLSPKYVHLNPLQSGEARMTQGSEEVENHTRLLASAHNRELAVSIEKLDKLLQVLTDNMRVCKFNHAHVHVRVLSTHEVLLVHAQSLVMNY